MSRPQLEIFDRRAEKRRETSKIMKQLRKDAERIAKHFHLNYKELKAERGDVLGHYGVCYSDGTIRIRLRHAVSGKPLRYSSLIDTLCHELAHLKYFNHGESFKRFHLSILTYARQTGIYRPKKPKVKNFDASQTASQGSLFNP